MDINTLTKKRSNISSLNRLLEKAYEDKYGGMGPILALLRAIQAERDEIETGRLVGGQLGFSEFIKGVVNRHPTRFTPEMIEWAADRRSVDRGD